MILQLQIQNDLMKNKSIKLGYRLRKMIEDVQCIYFHFHISQIHIVTNKYSTINMELASFLRMTTAIKCKGKLICLYSHHDPDIQGIGNFTSLSTYISIIFMPFLYIGIELQDK